MSNILIGYDDNLGLANDFCDAVGCKSAPFHNLTQMLEAYKKGELSALFIPAGTLPYVTDYTILSRVLWSNPQKCLI